MDRRAVAKRILLVVSPLFLISVLLVRNHLVSGILSLLFALAMFLVVILESEERR